MEHHPECQVGLLRPPHTETVPRRAYDYDRHGPGIERCHDDCAVFKEKMVLANKHAAQLVQVCRDFGLLDS